MRLRTVRKHGPDLPGAAAGGFENEMAAVRRPTGTLVAALVACQLYKLAGGGVHDVDVVIVVGAAPTESQQLAIGRPRRVDDITLVGEVQFRFAGAVGIHQVELWGAAAVADEGDGL